MTEQEREKTIEEIREALERAKGKYAVGTIADSWCRFLLSELQREREERERIEQAAKANLQRYETEKSLLTIQLQSAQQREQKLIEGLQFAHDRAQIAQQEEDEWGWAQALKMIRQHTRDILKEVGAEVG